MFNNLSAKCRETIISERARKIEKIGKNKERSKFFDKCIKSRNFKDMNESEIVYCFIQIIDLAADTLIEDFDKEFAWLTPAEVIKYQPYASALTTVDSCYGFEYLDL